MKLFGHSILSARSLSVFFSFLGIVFLYLLARELFNRETAVYTIFVVSVTFKHIFMSQEARSYSMFFLFSVLSFYLFSLLIKRKDSSKKIYFLYILSNSCMINIHYYSYPLIAAQGSYLLFSYFFARIEKKRYYAIFLCLFLVCAASIPNLSKLLQASALSDFWIEDKTWYENLFYFRSFFGWAFRSALGILFGLSFLWGCYSVFSRRSGEKKYALSFYLLSFWILLSFAIPSLYSFLKTDILLHRYFLGTLPAIQVLIAVGLTRIPEKFSKPLVCLAFLLLTGSLIVKDAYASQYLW